MATALGTPYMRGQSEAIVAREFDAPIEEGLIVSLKDEKTVKAFTTGETPYGVIGGSRKVGCGVVVAGLHVYAQAAEDCVPVIGKPVYVDATGKITSVEGSNTPINATFAEGKALTDGRVGDRVNVKCAAINFVGGF